MTHWPRTPRKRIPKSLAVIDADYCTGCGACMEVCPVDCILFPIRPATAAIQQTWCEVDWDRCIGCQLCIRIPRGSDYPYRLMVCPWDAIHMVRPADLPEAIQRMGGPCTYREAQRERLLELARRQVAHVRH